MIAAVKFRRAQNHRLGFRQISAGVKNSQAPAKRISGKILLRKIKNAGHAEKQKRNHQNNGDKTAGVVFKKKKMIFFHETLFNRQTDKQAGKNKTENKNKKPRREKNIHYQKKTRAKKTKNKKRITPWGAGPQNSLKPPPQQK